jgi:outer membrane protein
MVGVALLAIAVWPSAGSAQERQRITFEDAVRIALRQSSLVARSDNARAIDELAVTDAQMRFVPEVRFATSGTQSYGGSTAAATSGQSVNAQLSSSVVLFDGLSNVANLRGARLEQEAGVSDGERTRQDVVFSVIAAFLALIEAGEQVTVASENLAAQEARERDVRVLVDRGSRPIADLYQQQSSVASARSTLVEARRARDLANIEIVGVLRLDPLVEHDFEAPQLSDAVAAAELDAAALTQQALAQRADLTALGTRIAAAQQSVRAVSGGRWPTVSLSAGYGAAYSSNAVAGFADQFDTSRSGSLNLSVSIPVFDGLSTQRAMERANVETDNARIALQDMRQQVSLEVRRAVLDRASAQAQLEASQARVAASRQALQATERRYDAGVATLFEVTQARADFVDASSDEVTARYTLLFQDRVLDYYTGELDPSVTLN